MNVTGNIQWVAVYLQAKYLICKQKRISVSNERYSGADGFDRFNQFTQIYLNYNSDT